MFLVLWFAVQAGFVARLAMQLCKRRRWAMAISVNVVVLSEWWPPRIYRHPKVCSNRFAYLLTKQFYKFCFILILRASNVSSVFFHESRNAWRYFLLRRLELGVKKWTSSAIDASTDSGTVFPIDVLRCRTVELSDLFVRKEPSLLLLRVHLIEVRDPVESLPFVGRRFWWTHLMLSFVSLLFVLPLLHPFFASSTDDPVDALRVVERCCGEGFESCWLLGAAWYHPGRSRLLRGVKQELLLCRVLSSVRSKCHAGDDPVPRYVGVLHELLLRSDLSSGRPLLRPGDDPMDVLFCVGSSFCP